MLLGGSVVKKCASPREWAAFAAAQDFSASPAPFDFETPGETISAYLAAAEEYGIVIAELGVWKNTLTCKDAREAAKRQLKLADDIGCACCVNIVGSTGDKWDGAYPENYSDATYRQIVSSIREIIDAVKPTRAYYTIEPMPWMVPDGPDEYLKLIRDVDREMFGAHMDFVNMINSPKRALFSQEFIEECFEKLAPHIKSCHAKDIVFHEPFTAMIEETSPGKGRIDYGAALRAMDKFLPHNAPVLLEHMKSDEEYKAAYDHIAAAAVREGISIH